MGAYGAPPSMYDNLNNAANSYRLGLNIIIIIFLGCILLILCGLEFWLNQDILDYMDTYKHRPLRLFGIFTLIYIVGCIFLIPPNGVLIVVAFSFNHIYGPWLGIFLAVVFNYPCQHVAHLITFFIGRYAFRDMIYVKMIRYKSFFVLNSSIKKHGAYIHFLARISFLLPHPMLTYALAVTDIKISQFINGNHSCFPLSFFYIYIGVSANELAETFNKKGSVWLKMEVYYFIFSLVLIFCMIKMIWELISKEVERFENEFD